MCPKTVFFDSELEPAWSIILNQNLDDSVTSSEASSSIPEEEPTAMDAIKFVYEGTFKLVEYPPSSTFEDIISIALLQFGVSVTCKDRVEVSTYYGRVVTKERFESLLSEFPSPDIEFHIKVTFDFKKTRREARRQRHPNAELKWVSYTKRDSAPTVITKVYVEY